MSITAVVTSCVFAGKRGNACCCFAETPCGQQASPDGFGYARVSCRIGVYAVGSAAVVEHCPKVDKPTAVLTGYLRQNTGKRVDTGAQYGPWTGPGHARNLRWHHQDNPARVAFGDPNQRIKIVRKLLVRHTGMLSISEYLCVVGAYCKHDRLAASEGDFGRHAIAQVEGRVAGSRLHVDRITESVNAHVTPDSKGPSPAIEITASVGDRVTEYLYRGHGRILWSPAGTRQHACSSLYLARPESLAHSCRMNGAREQRFTYTAILLFVIAVVTLLPFYSSSIRVQSMHQQWQEARVAWRDTGMTTEGASGIKAFLARETFVSLCAFQADLCGAADALREQIDSLRYPLTVRDVLSVERTADRVSAELNRLSVRQAQAFESLLIVSSLFTILILVLFAYQGRRIAELTKHREVMVELKRRSVEITESERKKLSRDLHDGLSQNIALAHMSAERLPENPEKQHLLRALRAAMHEIRSFIYGLRTVEDLNEPIERIVERECALFAEHHSIKVQVCAGAMQGVSWQSDHYVHLIRMLHEALVNVARHADTDSAVVSLHQEAGYVQLVIEDAGRGMGAAREGLGRKGMTERAKFLSGTVTWSSGPQGGTRVSIRVPEVLS